MLLQQFVQGLDQSLPEVIEPDDILAVTSSINEIIKPGDATESEIPPSVLETTAGIINKLASAAKGSQGISVEKMETIANALVQTASAAIDVLPKQEMQPPSDLESHLIDTSSTDLSPRQQLKMLKEKEKEKEDTQRKTSQSIVASLDQVADTLLALQPDNVEYQSSFQTETVAVDVARLPSDKELLLGSGDILATIPPTSGAKAHEMWDVKMSVFKKNPYSWSESTGGQNISSSVIFLTIDSKNSETLNKSKEVNLVMPFEGHKWHKRERRQTPEETTERPRTGGKNTNGTTMAYHAFNVPADNVIPVIRMNWWDVEATFHVYISYGSPPTAEKYGEKRVITEDSYEAWLRGKNFSASFIPNTTDHGGVLYVGVQKLGPENSARGRQQQPTVQILSREDYTLSMSAVGCSSWNDNKKQWRLEGCNADIDLENGAISCKCHMDEWKVSVGTMTLPLPNSINFVNAFKNFLHLSDNSVMFSIVVSEFILYHLLMVFLCVDFHRVWMTIRRRVGPRISPITKDSGGAKNHWNTLCKVSLVPPDRMPARHVYQLTVTTGSMFGAGTTSRIGFQLFGSEATSPVKMLNPGGQALVRGSTLHFIMPVRESLGEVLLLHIWHDNSGEGDTAAWFLGRFVVRDTETDVVSYFTCNDWLSTEKGDGEVQKVVHASTEEELTSFTNVFNEATRDVFYDKQLWASALVAAPGSNFTKARRLSCCFTLLNTMMLSSAMWYKAENTSADTRVLNLGFVRFTIEKPPS
ncbi:polycystin-1-like protein 2 [Branchiostoma floridae x Branchiostoma belcheri]